MSREYRGRRGHGCLGFVLTFIIMLVGIGALLFFTTNVLDGVKDEVYKYIYPQKYVEQVTRCADEFGVDESLVYAVIRTESGFRPEVESHAGAIGLMQLMPDTFDWLQFRLDGEVIYPVSRLTDPDTNVRYGTYFLSHLLERYNGNVATVAAAYNAGTSTVDGWLEDSRYSSDGKTLSSIPYAETESYVAKVMKARDMYAHLYGGENKSASK